MKMMVGIAGAAVLIGGGVQVSGVLKSGEIYAKPYDVAYAELAATPIPPMITGMFPGAPRMVRNPGSIEWRRAVDIVLASGATPDDLNDLDRRDAARRPATLN